MGFSGKMKQLAESVKNEQELLENEKQINNGSAKAEKEDTDFVDVEAKLEKTEVLIKNDNKQEEKKKVTTKKTKAKKGRPLVAERRKQYTITLKPSLYEKTREAIEESGLSFSVFIEKAIEEKLGIKK